MGALVPELRRPSLGSGLKAIVADLHDLGYSNVEIAMVVQRSPQRIGRLLAEICPRPPHLRSIDDLPDFMRERVLQWLEGCSTRKVQNETEAQPDITISP